MLTDKARAAALADGETPFIMTPSRLKTIHKFEDLILQNEGWQDLRYYEAMVGGSVEYPCDVRERFMEAESSIAQILRGMVPSEEDGGYDAMSIDTIKGTIKTFLGISAAASALFDPSVLDGLDGNNSAMGAIAYRSIFMGGLPFPTSTSTTTMTSTAVSSNIINGSNSTNSTNSSSSTTESETCSMTKSTTYTSGVDKMIEQHFKSVVEDFRFIYDDIDILHNGEYVENGMRIRTYSAAVWLHMNTGMLICVPLFPRAHPTMISLRRVYVLDHRICVPDLRQRHFSLYGMYKTCQYSLMLPFTLATTFRRMISARSSCRWRLYGKWSLRYLCLGSCTASSVRYRSSEDSTSPSSLFCSR